MIVEGNLFDSCLVRILDIFWMTARKQSIELRFTFSCRASYT